MYYEFESRQNMKTLVFDDEGLTVGEKIYPYSAIGKMEITSAQLFATYGILTLTLEDEGKDVAIPFPRSYSGKLKRVIHEVERCHPGNDMGNDLLSEGSPADGRSLPASVQPSHAVPMMDPYEEVKKLKELLDLAIITKDEFEKKKKELLKL